jgi:ribonuclease Y
LFLVLGLVVGLVVGAAAGYFIYKSRMDTRQAQARADARSIVEDANREAETKRREADLAAKEAALKIKDDAEAEVRARRAEIARVEERWTTGTPPWRGARASSTSAAEALEAEEALRRREESSRRRRRRSSRYSRRSPALPGPRPSGGSSPASSPSSRAVSGRWCATAP